MDDFNVDRLEVGPMGANCYIVTHTPTKDACIIDPGGEPERIMDFIKKNGLKPKFIMNTHGHGDHIIGNGYFGVPIYIHRLEKDFLTDPALNLSGAFGLSIKTPKASKLLEDGDKVYLNDLEFEILHTPGHTPGGISIKLDGVVFTGDTLFAGTVGRTDLPDGDEKVLLGSIRSKLLTLDDDTVVYPGHGQESTIGTEKESNPFLK
ncbi:MAG: MBL fold metallo-hydrolase [Candidatus Omnitrophica bacterium]|nr:MBL fold metallo-hydrolase [Candidatus Omnitrophota bacterium]